MASRDAARDGRPRERWRLPAIFSVVARRFREERLGITAGSLTFTTLMALVPLLTVMLAVFTAFPVFASLQGSVERLLVQNLVPETIARPVMSALSQFAGKASRMGALGLVVLIATALALMLTMDRTLNAMWRVRRQRPLGRRLLLYWAALTLGPLLLGASLSLASYALSASRGLVAAIPGGFAMLIDVAQFLLLALVAAGLYRSVPNTPVKWAHAWVGGLFASLAVEAAKALLGWYVATVPAITSIYGAFAIVPILLLWIYLLWVVVLMGALLTASLPAMRQGAADLATGPGRGFERALTVLRLLREARRSTQQGLSVPAMALKLSQDPLNLQSVVESLAGFGWIGQLDEPGDARWVLLADLAATPAAPLLQASLLEGTGVSAGFRERAGWSVMTLEHLLGP